MFSIDFLDHFLNDLQKYFIPVFHIHSILGFTYVLSVQVIVTWSPSAFVKNSRRLGLNHLKVIA
jgi:hypothetical protein